MVMFPTISPHFPKIEEIFIDIDQYTIFGGINSTQECLLYETELNQTTKLSPAHYNQIGSVETRLN